MKKLFNESLLHTSKDFTDRVMNKIARETVPVRIPRWQYALFVCSLIILLSVPLLLIKKVPAGLPLFNLTLRLPPVSIQVFVILFVLLVIHKFLILKSSTGSAAL